MRRSTYVGLTALLCAAATIWLLPSASLGKESELDRLDRALRGTTERLGAAVAEAVAPVSEALKSTNAKAKAALSQTKQAADRKSRATATDPARQPPVHGTDPHGQGSVAVVDVNPSNERPLASDPTGKASGEDAIVGRPRGEKVNGAYHGHITILALLGSELAGVDSAPGETKNGPLQPIQAGILDPLCTSSGGATCLSVLTANSTTTANGSANDFAVARAAVLGIGVGAAESTGTIGEDANCQTSTGTARTTNVTTAGGAVAQVANSSSSSKSCRNAAPVVTNTSSVIGLGGAQVPIPAPGCANGTPDTVVGLPPLLPIVCNADEITGATAVREALDVFALQVATNSLAKETTAASESISVAPAGPETTGSAACSDRVDNDGDGVIDAADPGCHTDGNANNPASFDPNDTSEADARTGGSGGGDGGGDGGDDGDNAGSGGSGGATQCSDGADNDGDGVIDADDPGCHTDGDPNNAASYNPDDDSEADGGGASAGSLPVTGSNIIGLGLAGLLLLAGGLLLRRQEGAPAAA
ncbi:MAG TPA: LPXTG cell wall anchor domain-containing protein [Solirubrobacteraceae bacterium]|nr:LPXTG cell wall anchor domain-containing protein [Solirubrobacteraceae bacterium]